ncbi:MAG: RNA 2',3'-cyclic phosphodiesterase [Methanobacteriota archaeon]
MSFRAFISVPVGPRPGLSDFTRQLLSTGADMKLVEAAELHTTLKFLGDIHEGSVHSVQVSMQRAVKGEAPFTMRVVGVGTFPPRGVPRVLYMGLEGADALVGIANRLDDQLSLLGFKREDRPYAPHVTVARLRSPRRSEALRPVLTAHAKTDFGTVDVSHILLMKSELKPSGPGYTEVARVPLEG